MTLENWLANLCTEKPPKKIVAYYFGLFQSDTSYMVHLTGSETFDEDDDDWAASDDYEPREKYFVLPGEYNQFDWEEVLKKVSAELRAFFETKTFTDSFFVKAKAIATGFDDGDLIRLK